MLRRFALLPEQASTMASRVDHLLYYLVSVSVVFVALIAGAIMIFMVRYRRGSAAVRTGGAHLSMTLEAGWMLGPLVVAMVAFVWGAALYAALVRAPGGALVVPVVGQQGRGKGQDPAGGRSMQE